MEYIGFIKKDAQFLRVRVRGVDALGSSESGSGLGFEFGLAWYQKSHLRLITFMGLINELR